MKVKNKTIYEATQYISRQVIIDFFNKNNMEILKISDEFDHNDEPYLLIYYVNKDFEPDSCELSGGWWIWLNEVNELESCSDEYFRKYYEEVK